MKNVTGKKCSKNWKLPSLELDVHTQMEPDDDYELPPWSRTLAGWRQRFVLSFELALEEGPTIELAQAPCVSAEHAREAKSSADGLCTASTVWDAGIVLAAYAHRIYRCQKGAGLTCLELGGGTGIVG